MYSVWLVFLDKFLSGKAWVFYLLIIRCVSAFTLLVYSRSRKKGLNVTNKSLWKFLAVVGVFDVAAFAAVSYGYSHSSYIGVVTVLSATFSLPTMILAYIFLKERATSLQAIASALIIFGIIVISLV
jgi:drug/metabolite transporter (DMT)-like permease